MRVTCLCFLTILIHCEAWTDTKRRKFPPNFLFGAASSAYQVEGGRDEDGKGESIWDRFLHEHPELIEDGRNGDIASDSYTYWKRDVQMLRELGVDFYRFSVSWPRVMPSGFKDSINEPGLQYYDNLIDELLKYNIQPMITLYHFDLPQPLEDQGGWLNPSSPEWFESYAKVIFNRYKDKVKFWVTINQPNSICVDGYGTKTFAPGVDEKALVYECVKNVLLAHAKAYRCYEKKYKKAHKGNVGISLALNWFDHLANSTENKEATERARAFEIGLYMDPIWSKTGDFPALVKSIVAKNSEKQGFAESRLPKLTPDEIKLLKGSADFLGMNHYTTFLVNAATTEFESPSIEHDKNVELTQGPEWKPSRSPWLKSAPYGLYKACIHLNREYNYPTIIITEHGWSSGPGIKDKDRAENLREYLGALLLAMEDGTEMKGYTAWSLMDNVEWTGGTSERFGLYEVDFDSDDKRRTARLSALIYKHIIEVREVDKDWKPTSFKIEAYSNVKGEL